MTTAEQQPVEMSERDELACKILELKIDLRVRELEVAAARLWLDLVKASARDQ